MTYIDGFVLAVPEANKAAYLEHATKALAMLKEFGVARMVETWADDVPDGTLTDFRKAVNAEPGEAVVFSWMAYPDRATRDAAGAKMRDDPRMDEFSASMPFDGRRMIYGGFEPIVDEGAGGKAGYVDGFLVPVRTEDRARYREVAAEAATVFQDHGATRVVECWGTDVTAGEVTDFHRAVQAQDGEAVVFSWVEWPSKEARVSGWEKVMADERMQTRPADMPFDGKRLIYGGFTPILDA